MALATVNIDKIIKVTSASSYVYVCYTQVYTVGERMLCGQHHLQSKPHMGVSCYCVVMVTIDHVVAVSSALLDPPPIHPEVAAWYRDNSI